MSADESNEPSAGPHLGVDEQSPALPEGVYCVCCGYQVRGVVGPRCPECGYDLAGVRSTDSGIPWTRRHEIGRFRAYWSTVWAVSVRSRKFCEEHAREVSYRDARLFQWVTILHAFPAMTLALWAGVLYLRPYVQKSLASRGLTGTTFFAHQLILEDWPWVVMTICLLAYLVAITGVPSYFFQAKQSPIARQNAGIALSYYASAPLAVALIIAVVAAAVMIVSVFTGWFVVEIWKTGIVVTVSTVIALPFLWWFTLLHLSRGLMPQLRRTQISVAVLIPVVWLLLGGLILGVLPVVVSWCAVLFDSLR